MNRHLLKTFGKLFPAFLFLAAISVFAQPGQNADLERGIELIEAEDYKSAIAALDKCAAAAADVSVKSKCLQKRGLAFERTGEGMKAKADFNAAVALDPRDESAYFARARYHINSEGFNAALPDFNQVIKLNPRNAEAYFFRGQIFSEKGERDKAITDYSTAIKINFEYHEAFLLRAYEFLRTDEIEQAIADFTRFIELQPTDYEGYFQRAAAWQQKGSKTLAEADYAEAIRLQPALPELRQYLTDLNLSKEDVIEKAEKIQKEENPRRVIEFLKLFPEYGDEVEILYLKSVSYVEIREFQKADVYFQKQFDNFYKDAFASLTIADEYAQKPESAENLEMASLMYETALVSMASAELVNALRAVATEKNGLPAVKRNPKNLNGFAEFMKIFEQTAIRSAETDFKAGQTDRALQNFNKALEMNPKSKAAYLGRAKVYRKLGKVKLAQADEAKAKLLPAQK